MLRVAETGEEGLNRFQSKLDAVFLETVEEFERSLIRHNNKEGARCQPRRSLSSRHFRVFMLHYPEPRTRACLHHMTEEHAYSFFQMFALHDHIDHAVLA